MSWIMLTHTFLLLFVLVACFIAIQLNDLLYAVIVLAGASVALSLVFYLLQAPDVAITNAAVYGGIATIIYMVAISKTKREEET